MCIAIKLLSAMCKYRVLAPAASFGFLLPFAHLLHLPGRLYSFTVCPSQLNKLNSFIPFPTFLIYSVAAG
jgi:hypothetical protein